MLDFLLKTDGWQGRVLFVLAIVILGAHKLKKHMEFKVIHDMVRARQKPPVLAPTTASRPLALLQQIDPKLQVGILLFACSLPIKYGIPYWQPSLKPYIDDDSKTGRVLYYVPFWFLGVGTVRQVSSIVGWLRERFATSKLFERIAGGKVDKIE